MRQIKETKRSLKVLFPRNEKQPDIDFISSVSEHGELHMSSPSQSSSDPEEEKGDKLDPKVIFKNYIAS